MSISKTAIAATGIFAAISLTSLTAVSLPRQQCPVADGSSLVAEAQKERGEDPSALAFTASGRLLYVLVNHATWTFSIVMIDSDGRGCLVSTGTDWGWLPSEGERP